MRVRPCLLMCLLAHAGENWTRANPESLEPGLLFSSPKFWFVAGQVFNLQDDSGEVPHKMPLKPAQLAYLMIWVSTLPVATFAHAYPASSRPHMRASPGRQLRILRKPRVNYA